MSSTTISSNKCVYISEKKINVILAENKSKADFITDYDMWNGDLIALQSDGYTFPELDKKNNKIKSNNDLKKKLQEKKKNNKKVQKQRYNTEAKTSLVLNTGYVNEDFNLAVEELLISEHIWIRFENQTLPVLCKSMDMTFKTSLNDKLINHEIRFEFAFDKINNVR